MPRTLIIILAGLLTVALAAAVAIWFLLPVEPDAFPAEQLSVYFLDVGQGDAVLIRAPEGQDVLYDGGTRASGTLEHLQQLGVEELPLVIASHPHADHIGGLIDVIRYYRPEFVLDNGQVHTTQTYEDFLEVIDNVGAGILDPSHRTITIGEHTELEIIPPPGNDAWGLNDNSVVAVIQHGDFRLLLTGDAEERQWDYLVDSWSGALRNVHVHKASHHGSRNGDTEAGLRVLTPHVVVIGVGENNRYGHPHEEAITLYTGVGAEIYRTDLHGTIRVVASTDGSYDIIPERVSDPLASPATAADAQ